MLLDCDSVARVVELEKMPNRFRDNDCTRGTFDGFCKSSTKI